MFETLVNKLNAAIGRKQEFEELLATRDIGRVIAKMDSHKEQTVEALREYDPAKHKINYRRDKIILDKNGNFKRKIKRWKLPIDYPKFINEIALVFIYGQPVKWGQSSQDTNEAFSKFTELLHDVHFDSKIRQCKRYAGSETQSAMLWRVYKDKDNKPSCQIRVLAASKGDEIYSRWDQYDNLLQVGWGYYLTEGEQTYYHFDLFTDKIIYHCKRGDRGWEVIPEQNLIGKIPVILFQQEKEWAGVEPLIEREEYIISRSADVNDYFSDPMLVLDADIIKNMPDRDDENKTLIKKNGTSTEAAAGYLTWDGAWESKKQELTWLQNHILSKTFTPNIDFENMKALSNVSGKALKQMMVLADIKASKHKEIHDELMDRVAGLCRSIIGNVLDVSLKKQCENLIVTHEFQDPFGEDVTDVINNITKAKDGGFLSQESAVELSPLTKQPQTEIERLEGDQAAAAAAQRDIFGQMATQATGGGEADEGSAE